MDTSETTANAVAQDLRFADPLIAKIREQWRNRQSVHRAEKSLTLQMSAICRRYEGVQGKADKPGLTRAKALLERIESGQETGPAAVACLPLLLARSQIEPHRKAQEKNLEKLVKQLPIAYIVEQTPNLGYLTLVGIIGEAGDLSAYRSLRGLWKRMGEALIDNERQRCKSDAIEALKHGYSPSRHSVSWNLGSVLIGCMGKGPRPRVGEDIEARADLSVWQRMFVSRLRYEAQKNPEHRRPDVSRKGEVFESFSKHAFNRAARVVRKAFLKHLRQEWIAATTTTQLQEAA